MFHKYLHFTLLFASDKIDFPKRKISKENVLINNVKLNDLQSGLILNAVT